MSMKDFSDTKPMATNFYEAAIGERNQSYYLSKFENFDTQGPGLHASWNWAAFFFTGFWALYRKMYGWFFAWILFAAVVRVALDSPTWSSSALSVLSVATISFSIVANSLYHQKVKARIAASQKLRPKVFGRNQGQAFSGNHPPGNEAYAAALAEIEEGRLDKGAWARAFAESGGDESKAKAVYIKVRAGAFQNAVADATQQGTDFNPTAKGITSGVNMWVPIGFGGLVLLGIVAAIALPAYQDRTQTKRLASEVVLAATSARVCVSEIVATSTYTGFSACGAPPSSKYVGTVSVEDITGNITASGLLDIAEVTVHMYPTLPSSRPGVITAWTCSGSPPSLMPTACRSED